MLPDIENELLCMLALTFTPNVGHKTAKTLLQHFGSANDIFKASLKTLKSIDGMNEIKARSLKAPEVLIRAEAELIFSQKQGHQILLINDEQYPQRLKQCADAPIVIYYKGTAHLNMGKIVAVIGTRKNTDYGMRMCEELIEELQHQKDTIIVSGLAYGIDAIAHKKSVKLNIPTIGVLGHGLDRIYPASHKQLAYDMLEHGGLLTEFPSDTKPDRENFPMRNRIVAGISDVTVVVESDIKGGALITAFVANGYNREVAAFPGRVYDAKSSGCNMLIRKNFAAMITNGNDLLELMNWNPDVKKPVQQKLLLALTDDEQKIVDLLQQKDQVHTDELLNSTALNNSQLAANLLNLEMQGIVKALPGKCYRMN